MKRTVLFTAIGSVFLLAAPTPVSGQAPCQAGEAVVNCLQRATIERRDAEIAQGMEAATEKLNETAEQEVQDKSTVAAIVSGAGSLRDFLPAFASGLGLDGIEQADGSFKFENPILDRKDHPLRVAYSVTVKRPEVFEALANKIPEDTRADRLQVLKEQFGDFDAVDVEVSFNLENRARQRLYFGRDYEDYRPFFTGFLEEAVAELDDTQAASALVSALTPDMLGPPDAPVAFDSLSDPDQQRIGSLIEEAAKEQAAVALAIDDRFGDIDELVNNQPQFIAAFIYRHRDGLAGPSERQGSLRFETGFINVNKYLRWAHEQRETEFEIDGNGALTGVKACAGRTTSPGGDLVPSYACFVEFLEAHPKRGQAGHRVAIEAEWVDTEPFPTPLEDIDFSLDESEKLVGSLSYGKYLQGFQLIQGQGDDVARFDLEVKYQDVDGDEMRQDRWNAEATISQDLPGNTTLSIGAVWANKPEYRGEVDKEFGARFGLKWKVDKQQ